MFLGGNWMVVFVEPNYAPFKSRLGSGFKIILHFLSSILLVNYFLYDTVSQFWSPHSLNVTVKLRENFHRTAHERLFIDCRYVGEMWHRVL